MDLKKKFIIFFPFGSLKLVSDDDDVILDGRLFQTRDAAAANERSPMVEPVMLILVLVLVLASLVLVLVPVLAGPVFDKFYIP